MTRQNLTEPHPEHVKTFCAVCATTILIIDTDGETVRVQYEAELLTALGDMLSGSTNT